MSVRFETSSDDPWLNGVVIRASQSLRADRIDQVLEPWTPTSACDAAAASCTRRPSSAARAASSSRPRRVRRTRACAPSEVSSGEPYRDPGPATGRALARAYR